MDLRDRLLMYFRWLQVSGVGDLSKKKFNVAVLTAVACAGLLYAGLVRPGFLARPVEAKPAFMDRYKHDPFSRPELRDKCTVCHVGHGGGERNDFGEAFEDGGFRITPKLRAKFSELFIQQEAGQTKAGQ
jgi:hypothetical protein